MRPSAITILFELSFPTPLCVIPAPPQQCQTPTLEPQISFSPCPLHFHPLQGWKTLWLSTNRDSPPFPQAGPFLFKHPTYFIIILCPRGKDFFFPLPFSPFLLWCIPAPKACGAASPARCSSIPAAGPVEELELEGGMPAAAPPPAS